jgi:hypothetical protein
MTGAGPLGCAQGKKRGDEDGVIVGVSARGPPFFRVFRVFRGPTFRRETAGAVQIGQVGQIGRIGRIGHQA